MQIKWHARALADLDEVEIFIAQDNPFAAAKVVLKIIKTVSLLNEQPGIGRPGRVPGTRELVVQGIPYIIPYRVKEYLIQVLRVYHTSRKWPSRL